MKLGFALKKSKKQALQQPAQTQASSAFASALPVKREAEKVFVTDFDPSAPPAVEFDADGNAKRTLVIPLIKANAWKSSDSDSSSAAATTSAKDSDAALTVDERAAKELLADAQSQANGIVSSASSHASTLVIPMNSSVSADTSTHTSTSSNNSHSSTAADASDATSDAKRAIQAKLFNFERQAENKQKALLASGLTAPTAPILKQNVVPGMDALADVNDKYRLDVSMRPEALDVHSDAYALVPIEDFGAALLRGMGWKGSVNDNDASGAEPKPRHKLLGLGATVRPPVPGESKRKTHRRPPTQAAPSGTGREADREAAKARHSGLNDSRESRKDERRRSPSRDRHRGRVRDEDDDRRAKSHRHSRDDRDDDKRRRRASRSRERSSRDRDRSSDRRGRDRDERRKRSRSRDDRSSDRKRSSRR